MPIEKILIVDDEKIVRQFLTETLQRKNFEVSNAENGHQALSLLKDHIYDIVITDMKLPDLTGIDLIKKIKEISSNTIVIVITAYGSVDNAVEAMRLGAFHYLIKPFSPDTLETIIEKAEEHLSLLLENQYYRQETSLGGLDQIIGESSTIKQIMKDIPRIAQSNASVFIHGESGTGKEVIAQAIHDHSLRNNRPFIKVNCAAVPETLIESEFFGHEKGAFTGANAKRLGRFELANGGTLLLDEITEIPLQLQAKLLRAIQEQEFERVGGTKSVKVDVRLISTSNRDVKEAIDKKILREDLYYRLNVVPIYLPPLRERPEDIIPLANYFLEKMCLENRQEKKQFNEESIQKLLTYQWPGNIRELGNLIERAVVMEPTTVIHPEYLHMGPYTPQIGKEKKKSSTGENLPVGITLQELEKRLIIETLQAQKNNRTRTAEILGISIRTLRNKLHEYNVKPGKI